MSGARMAPTLVPELKMPVASERSLCGNHSATVLMAAGKLPDSPRPRQEARDAEFEGGVGQRMAHRGEAPDAHDDDVADAGADLVDNAAGDQQADGIGELEGVHDVAVIDFGQADACGAGRASASAAR